MIMIDYNIDTYFVFQNFSNVSENRNPTMTIIMSACDKSPNLDWWSWLVLIIWLSSSSSRSADWVEVKVNNSFSVNSASDNSFLVLTFESVSDSGAFLDWFNILWR